MNLKRLAAIAVACAISGTSFGYSITHSYSGGQNTEYYGACENGEQFVIIEAGNETFSYEGPAGSGQVAGGMDSAARAACGE